MNYDTFHLIGSDEQGGPQETEHANRLVCRIRGGGKLTIWGSIDNTRNIDTVLKAGLPVHRAVPMARAGRMGKQRLRAHALGTRERDPGNRSASSALNPFGNGRLQPESRLFQDIFMLVGRCAAENESG